MKNDRADIQWAPRVNLHKIRALYLSDAQGIRDDESIDAVGIELLLRCRSILEYTEARDGHVKCMRCAASGITTMIDRETQKSTEWLRCPICSWQIQWRVYVREAEKKSGQLNASRARPAFEAYVRKYPQYRSARDKMLAIDRLIHQFHWTLRGVGKDPQADRSASVNLLEGSRTQILDLLDGLAYDKNTTPGLLETRHWWRSQKPNAKRLDDRQADG